MAPSVVSSGLSPYGVGWQTQLISIACIDVTHGVILSDCQVTVKWYVPETRADTPI